MIVGRHPIKTACTHKLEETAHIPIWTHQSPSETSLLFEVAKFAASCDPHLALIVCAHVMPSWGIKGMLCSEIFSMESIGATERRISTTWMPWMEHILV